MPFGVARIRHNIRAIKGLCPCGAVVAHSLGKGEVTSSSLVMGKLSKLIQNFNQNNIRVGARVAKGGRL